MEEGPTSLDFFQEQKTNYKYETDFTTGTKFHIQKQQTSQPRVSVIQTARSRTVRGSVSDMGCRKPCQKTGCSRVTSQLLSFSAGKCSWDSILSCLECSSISLCPGCPGICHVEENGLKLTEINSLASAPTLQILRLKVCASTSGLKVLWLLEALHSDFRGSLL
uniref:RIKEN cDNA 5730522E02 gene n=1 Tax=Mus spicilegus TaxID=10103 RepID=A0A8C6HB35_MUSSI